MRFSRRKSLALIPALAGLATRASAQPVPPLSNLGGNDDDPPMVIKLVVLDMGGTLIADHGEVPEADNPTD